MSGFTTPDAKSSQASAASTAAASSTIAAASTTRAPAAAVLFPETWNKENTTIEKLNLQRFYPHREKRPWALVLHGILSEEECQALIDRSEKQEFSVAEINIGGGKQKKMTDVRNNDRTFIDDVELAAQIWQRISDTLPRERDEDAAFLYEQKNRGGNWTAVGVNERLRVLRYDPGTHFAPHFDGAYERVDPQHPQCGDISMITAQIYLNQGFQGGATAFLDPNEWHNPEESKIDVVPRTGSVLLFEHRLLHEGSKLLKGRKYTIRSDIMFHRDKVEVDVDADADASGK
jgi:predicted 2-oxoglutarate/Fe(II)-dependent dioxygenase YbiX